MNPVRLIRYHITLIQLEQYDLKRYFAVLRARYAVRTDMRQKAVWTAKLKAIAGIAFIIGLIPACLSFYLWGALSGVLILIASLCAAPLWITFAVLIILPVDITLKNRLINAARRTIQNSPKLKIVGITGSYGKTTMKETIKAILAERFTVLATPESVNTPVGVARLILEKLTPETDVLIVEMGAHHAGDIHDLCAITQPTIAVLTGINEAHIERFGNIETTIRTKFEIVRHAKPDAIAVLNADDRRVKNEYEKNLGERTALFYGAKQGDLSRYGVTDVRFEQDGLHQSFSLTNAHGTAYQLKTALLGDYAPTTIMGAVCVAEALGMTRAEITHGVAMTRPVTHRLQPFNAANGILVIDDSYNGNPDGAREAIRVLARFKSRRKLYVTPGLVEMGSRNAEIHRAIGTELAAVADIVILIKNSATIFIAEGLKSAGFKNQDILWFNSAAEAHASLPATLKNGDVVVFQNDWPDNYL